MRDNDPWFVDFGIAFVTWLGSAYVVYKMLGAGLTDGQEFAGLVALTLVGVGVVGVASLAWWWPSGPAAPIEVHASGFRVAWPRAHGSEIAIAAAGLGYVAGGVVQAFRLMPSLDAIGFSGAGTALVAGLVYAFAVPIRSRLPQVRVALEGRVLTVDRFRTELDDPASQVVFGNDWAGEFLEITGPGGAVRIRGHGEALRGIGSLVRALGKREGRADEVPPALAALRTE